MKTGELILALALLAPSARAAEAQPPPAPARAMADTSGFLPRWLHASVDAGPGWMQAPAVVRSRYTVGLSAALDLAVRPARGVTLAVRADYMDLPAGTLRYVTDPTSGRTVPLAAISDVGHGSLFAPMGVVAIRAGGSWWAEVGAGMAYFHSGLAAFDFLDPGTGGIVHVPDESGWGPAMNAGVRFDFQPNARDRLYLMGRVCGTRRADRRLVFLSLRVGYRIP